jgi:predicted DNA-binding transcriptional regulator AlpA
MKKSKVAAKRTERRAAADLALAGKRVVRRPEAEAFTGCKPTTFNDLIDKNQLPRPIQLGERAVGWLEEELRSWREFKTAERDGTTACRNWREFHEAKKAPSP